MNNNDYEENQVKILFVGYAGVHSKKWVDILCRRGHEVVFVFPKARDSDKIDIHKKAKVIEMPFNGKKGYFLNAVFLHKIAIKYKPNVVNVHNASGTGILMRLARLENVLLSVWGSDVYIVPYTNRVCMNIIKKNLLYANAIASTSYCMKEKVKELIGDSRDIIVTPFGIDTNKFDPDKFARHDKDLIVIGNIKSLERKYGIDDLIVGIYELQKMLMNVNKELFTKIHCDIYGDGSQKKELQLLINKLNLQNTVKLKGYIDNSLVPKVLSEMDIFCVTSISESFGVAAVEAQSMEVPVVATDADGFKEVVDDGVTGIIVKKKNPKSIAEGLMKLVLDKNLRQRMGKNGRKRVREKFDIEVNVLQMENAYKRAMQNERL